MSAKMWNIGREMSEGFEWFHIAANRLGLCGTEEELIKTCKKSKHELVEKSRLHKKPLGSEFIRFIVGERDPMTLTLKAHLFVERFLEEIVRRKFPHYKMLLEESPLSFRDKARVLRAKNYIDEKLYRDIILLNQLRNSYAHRLTYDIAEFDVSQFYYCDDLYERVQTSTTTGRRWVNLYTLTLVLYQLLMRLTRKHPYIAKIAKIEA